MENAYSENVSIKELIVKLKIWFKYLLSKCIYIISFILLGALAGLGYSLFSKPIYTAKTTFALEENGRSSGGLLDQYSGLASMAGIDIGGSGNSLFQGENIIELYKSRLMLQRALLSPVSANSKQLLINRYLTLNKSKKQLSDLFINIKTDTNNKLLTRLQDSVLQEAVEDINKNILKVQKPDKKLSIIEVDVLSKDETFSKCFDEQIVKNVNEFYIQTKTKKSLDNLAILQHQTDSVRSILNRAISTAAMVTDATPNLNPTKLILRTTADQSRANAEANKAILSQLIQNLELAKMSLRKETPLIQVIDSPTYPLKIKKVGKLIGMVIGAFLAGLITIIVFTLKKVSL